MSLGPMSGVLGSAAGAPLSQTKGSESERTAREGAAQDNRVDDEKKADAASGIGQTEEDQAAEDRDADGRRLWEAPDEDQAEASKEEPVAEDPRPVKDPKGESGNRLDISG